MADALILGFGSALFTGLALGTLLLGTGAAAGWAVGRWLYRRPVIDTSGQQQAMKLMGELSRWTSNVSTDVSEYRGIIENMAHQVAEHAEAGATASQLDPASMLAQMLEANRRLQRRLDMAEATLRQQSQEIAAYMSEARTDALTKLNNRRVFDETLASSLAAWHTQGKSVALLLIDIDHFKRLNDNHGHLAGDAMLKALAKLLRDNKPNGAVTARFGGEEFALILHQFTSEEACAAAQAIRQATFAHTLGYERQSLQVTLSIGVAVASFREDAVSMVKRCDEALYAAKSGGRNTVYFHDGYRPVPCLTQTLGDSYQANQEEKLAADFQDVCRDLREKLQQVSVVAN